MLWIMWYSKYVENLLLKSLVSQTFISHILAHFYERRKIIAYMYVMILLIDFVILYFICFRNKNKYM